MIETLRTFFMESPGAAAAAFTVCSILFAVVIVAVVFRDDKVMDEAQRPLSPSELSRLRRQSLRTTGAYRQGSEDAERRGEDEAVSLLRFGNTPVPYTVSWSAESQFSVEPCRYADGRRAICQNEAPGQGTPIFGKPHSQRQRQAIVEALCDLCGRPLRSRTKVSLSHARVRMNGAEGPAILQVEPLLHRECASTSMRFCPSLRRDIAAGSLMIRQVTRCREQFAIMGPQYVGVYVPDYEPQPGDKIVGHAKVELIGWIDRDMRWLGVSLDEAKAA